MILDFWQKTFIFKENIRRDINIHSASPELPIPERFNNILKALDFVTMTLIQAIFPTCLGLCHVP